MALLRGRCLYDAVDLYDGETATPSAQLASFCGSDLPPSVTSTGSKMLVVFRSDIALTARGFRLLYRAVSPPDPGMAVAYPKPLLRGSHGHCTYCHSSRTIREATYTNGLAQVVVGTFPSELKKTYLARLTRDSTDVQSMKTVSTVWIIIVREIVLLR